MSSKCRVEDIEKARGGRICGTETEVAIEGTIKDDNDKLYAIIDTGSGLYNLIEACYLVDLWCWSAE